MCIEKWLSIKINLNNKPIKHNYERINHREFHTKAHKTQTKTVFSVFFFFLHILVGSWNELPAVSILWQCTALRPTYYAGDPNTRWKIVNTCQIQTFPRHVQQHIKSLCIALIYEALATRSTPFVYTQTVCARLKQTLTIQCYISFCLDVTCCERLWTRCG